MIEMEKPNIECTELSADGKYGKFVVGPLERGYGTTIGNSLRRILLSSLPGAACTSIKIEGIQHEFSTVPGVMEDVTEIILNLKKMAIKLHSDEVKTVYIDAKGAQEITAGDLKCDSDVEIFNPELHIATLNSDAKLNAEITISKGRGYVSAERNKAELQPIIGVIPMDSIYTPVTKVNYTVENVRVGQYTDREELAVEVWTNGTVKPDDAVSLAAKIMNELLVLFIDLSEEAKNTDVIVEKEENQKEKVLEMTIEELDLSVRSYNCLKRAGINTV
ncbi:MAG: DNA-directed RNA polymerase subunit alpha, partial [Clostridia bacterium]|nr:DNA-directed RNA polymerase subunit alpha [Clostridia bacterium]